MTRLPGKLSATVEFRKPEASDDQVRSSDLWKYASSIPGVTPGFDAAGSEVRAFGAETSGQAMLFDPQGRLLFSGGITAARGHQGDNDGLDTVEALAAGPQPATGPTLHAPVFGCSLRDPDLKEVSAWRRL